MKKSELKQLIKEVIKENTDREDWHYESGVHYVTIKKEKGERCPPDMKEYEYHWKHFPTGQTGKRTICCFSQQDFEKLLKGWNVQQPKTWLYSI